MVDLSIVIPGVVTMTAGLGWIFRLEGRINTEKAVSEAKFEGLKELINNRFDASDQRLGRIERSMNGHLAKE